MTIFIGWVEFDAITPVDVCVGWCEFDAAAALEMSLSSGGRGTPLRSSVKSFATAQTPSAVPNRYHGRHDDAAERAAAAELDDEEAVLTLLMEIFYVV